MLTYLLWFNQISDFAFLNSTSNEIVYKTEEINPYRIISNIGEEQFDIIYSGISQSSQLYILNKIIVETLENGKFIDEVYLDYSNFENQNFYIYDYPFNMDIEVFMEIFGFHYSSVQKEVESFDEIIFVENSPYIDVYFVNEYDKIAKHFQIKDEYLCYELKLLKEQIKNENEIPYISNVDTYGNIYFEPEFVPYPYIIAENKYSNDGQIGFDSVSKYVNVFLNPQTMSDPRPLNGAYTFGDKNKVVMYYPTNVIEYSDYEISNQKEYSNFSKSYNIAISFINKDLAVSNEYYLADYTIKNDEITFYFDYVINNTPIIMTEELKNFTGLNHTIEITVENGQVVNYKKYAYSFYNIDESSTQDVEFKNQLIYNQPVPYLIGNNNYCYLFF